MAVDSNGMSNDIDRGTIPATKKAGQIQPHWWRKTLAGGVLGLTFSIAVVGIFAWAGPGGISAPDKVQFNMWMITPIWMLIFALVYLFRTGNQALRWLCSLNILAFGILLIVRGIMTA